MARRLERLPGWVVPERESVAREAAPYRDMAPAERLRATWAACRSAARQLRTHPGRERILAWRDPLPESSRVLLRRA